MPAAPSLESRERRGLKRGNEDQTHGPEPASTGGPVPGDSASSTQEDRPPPQMGQDPRDDDAGYLFGPDGEEDAERPDSIAVLADSTVASGTKEIGQREGTLETSGLFQKICSVCVRGFLATQSDGRGQ